ncbi:cytochrome P450 2J4-like [Pelodytes ibericus]
MEFSSLVLFTLALLGFLWWKVTRPKSFPPGPTPLPLIGNLWQMDFTNPIKDIKAFSKVYGNVYSLYLGPSPLVVVRGFKLLKEVLVTKGLEFADRPQNRLAETLFGSKGLVIAPYGPTWKDNRRFTLSTLRRFGMGKDSMEERICGESAYIIQDFTINKDTLIDPHSTLDNAVSNIISSIVLGRRYDYDDSTLRETLNLIHENIKLSAGFWVQLYNAFGFVHHLPLPHRRIFRNVETVFRFLEKILEEHKSRRTPREPRDYIDCYLDELDKEQEDNSKKSCDPDNLFACVVDLFVAGTETTCASLEWCLLYMMVYPDIQEKCQNEIDKVRGAREHLDYKDRLCMPYTQAVLQEVQRFITIVPLGVGHSALRDVQLNGYTIPKGTVVLTDLSSLNYDGKYWKYPHEFSPENFLNEDGELIKPEAFLPFSAGPRVCLGENLARMEIFLIFTSLLTHFEFHWPDPSTPPDLTPVFGISQAPKNFKMRLVSREANPII